MAIEKPYEPRAVTSYELPNGEIVKYRELVRPLVSTGERVRQEIMLLQMALGVRPDGIIGPKTRDAARRAFERSLEA